MHSSGVQQLHATRHYASLDGLRGFAAISVVLYHLGHWLNMPALATNGGLAVDLFFCLSGYVLPRAYESRMGQMSVPMFMRLRLIRLMPLVLLALAISAPYVALRGIQTGEGIPYRALAISLWLGVLNLPYFGAPEHVGGPLLFPLNGPQYTLFLELLVNWIWWSSRRVNQTWFALAVALLSFLLLPFMGLGGDVPGTFWSGFPRVGASFFAGVGLCHLDKRLPSLPGATATFWVLCATMVALFFVPMQAPLAMQISWVLILSPLLVLSGTRATLSPAVIRLSIGMGALSYPIYCLQYPVFEWVNGIYRSRMGPQNIVAEGPLTVSCILAVSYAALRFWDAPVRRLITNRLQ